jgi:hypothetical protein
MFANLLQILYPLISSIMKNAISCTLRSAGISAVLIALAAATATTTISTQAARAQVYCQCVGFVQKFTGYLPIWSAKDAGPALARKGYRQVGAQNGAIAVFQPWHGGVDRTHGHIGIVVSSGNGFVTIRSANQWSNRQFSQAGCSNVSDVNFRVNGGVTFWAR